MLVVGYNIYELPLGYSVFTPSFVESGTDSIPLQDLKLMGTAYDLTEMLMKLNESGDIAKTYYWTLPANVGDTENTTAGWYEVDETSPIGVARTKDSVKVGEGVYISITDTSAEKNKKVSIQSAGNVILEPYSYDISNGYSLIGNGVPLNNMTIQNLKLTGAAYDFTEMLMKLDESGNIAKTYYWTLPANVGDMERANTNPEPGWYMVDETSSIGVSWATDPVKAGEGFYINISGTDAEGNPKKIKLVFPEINK